MTSQPSIVIELQILYLSRKILLHQMKEQNSENVTTFVGFLVCDCNFFGGGAGISEKAAGGLILVPLSILIGHRFTRWRRKRAKQRFWRAVVTIRRLVSHRFGC